MGLLDIFRINKFKSQIETLEKENNELSKKLQEIGADDYFEVQKKIADIKDTLAHHEVLFSTEVAENNQVIERLREQITNLNSQNEKLSKQINSQTNKLQRSKGLYQSVEYAIDNFFNSNVDFSNCKLPQIDFSDYELICPTITPKLHCMDIADLRKAYRANEKQINELLSRYSSRYTTKANQAIYNLMVIALRAELQNILYDLKYGKLDSSIESVKNVSAKYLKIAGDGNQSIVGTLTKFIGEIEFLFINAVKIEYNYYVKKEQAKQEQLAIREQMRVEAEERRALAEEQKKIEKEESKYTTEINKITEALNQTDNSSEIELLNKRILELQNKLSEVVLKKDEITKLQNGKAGNIYIISNLGSFGDKMFKIGMTRRMNPQDRVNELGDASVPFKFDVHCFIFSEDAVELEKKMHNILDSKRVNKVNLRKEFFNTTIDELEEIVLSIDPTAEFNRTMLAEEYYQSLSSDAAYTSDVHFEIDDE